MPTVEPGRAMAPAVSIDWLGADALERGVDADPAGQLQHRAIASSPRPRRCRWPRRSRASSGGRVAAQGDDPVGAEAMGGEHGGEADGAVADDGDGVARAATPALTAAW